MTRLALLALLVIGCGDAAVVVTGSVDASAHCVEGSRPRCWNENIQLCQGGDWLEFKCAKGCDSYLSIEHDGYWESYQIPKVPVGAACARAPEYAAYFDYCGGAPPGRSGGVWEYTCSDAGVMTATECPADRGCAGALCR